MREVVVDTSSTAYELGFRVGDEVEVMSADEAANTIFCDEKGRPLQAPFENKDGGVFVQGLYRWRFGHKAVITDVSTMSRRVKIKITEQCTKYGSPHRNEFFIKPNLLKRKSTIPMPELDLKVDLW